MVKNMINPRDIPDQLLEKYQRSGPRYTSYPTAPQFKQEFDQSEIIKRWQETNESENGISLYTHFPFCNSRCLYCGCYTHIGYSIEIKKQYIEALKREVQQIMTIISPQRQVSQLALGGGSPNHMPMDFIYDYIRFLKENLKFDPVGERSIEMDPRKMDKKGLDLLVELGFNRFSFGVQDLDRNVQENIQRILDEEKLSSLISYLRNLGQGGINIDLIYGLPGQTPHSFSATIEKIVTLRPSRIALFGYAHVPWVSPHQKKLEKYKIPIPTERMELFGIATQLLLEAGYQHVGMDHFALPGDELLEALNNKTLTRNFMGYTTRRGLDLIGIGASSISSVGITYAQNDKDIQNYINNTSNLHWNKGLILSTEDCLRREIILELFCNFYLDIRRIEKTFNIDFQVHFSPELASLEPIKADGLIEVSNKVIKVTELGRFFIRNICMTFDQYLKKEKDIAEKRYSKTI